MPSKMIGTCLALMAFSTALVVGLAAGNTMTTILLRAMAAMFVCYYIGQLFGHIAQKAIDENVDLIKEQNPIKEAVAPDGSFINEAKDDTDDDDVIIAQPVTAISDDSNQAAANQQNVEQEQNQNHNDENKQAA